MNQQPNGVFFGASPEWIKYPVVFPWFALRVRSNFERVAAQHLRSRGLQEYTPSYKWERVWSDRRKEIDQMLFPGYVFCRFDPNDRLPVVSAPGVVGVVGLGKTPAPIPDIEIERIAAMLKSGLLVKPWPFLHAGQSVLIERGPLAGMEGILDVVKGQCRLIVSIQLLQRSVSAEVERDWARPIGQCITTI